MITVRRMTVFNTLVNDFILWWVHHELGLALKLPRLGASKISYIWRCFISDEGKSTQNGFQCTSLSGYKVYIVATCHSLHWPIWNRNKTEFLLVIYFIYVASDWSKRPKFYRKWNIYSPKTCALNIKTTVIWKRLKFPSTRSVLAYYFSQSLIIFMTVSNVISSKVLISLGASGGWLCSWFLITTSRVLFKVMRRALHLP